MSLFSVPDHLIHLFAFSELNWSHLPGALVAFVIFGVVGILVAILGYKMFDKFTPGDLHREIVENKNIAAAIVAGSVIIGVCLLLSAAMS